MVWFVQAILVFCSGWLWAVPHFFKKVKACKACKKLETLKKVKAGKARKKMKAPKARTTFFKLFDKKCKTAILQSTSQ